jgi:hypothetical protein
MMPLIYLLFAFINIALFIMAIQLLRQHRQPVHLFLVLVVFGLAYDNLIIGLGQFIGAGTALQWLNFPRYAIHALVTPLLILVGLYLARYAGVRWCWGQKVTFLFSIITLALILLGSYTDMLRLQLEPALEGGVIRYKNAAAFGPPLPAIITIVILIGFGIAIVRRTRWPWLLLAAVFMFIASAGSPALSILTNIGEVVLAAGLVFTARRFPPMTYDELFPILLDAAT